ncbi:MAG: ribonuclease D [Pseudohongiellaceae bacterium]
MTQARFSDGMPIEYVSDASRLNGLCEVWSEQEFIAVDTEFERTSTFYARIGLLQIADGSSCYLVDPMTIDDWSGFKKLLATPSCTLVMHSCSEDLGLLQTFLGCLPVSLFDTQLAAAFLGIGFSISYQGLVESLLGIEVTKDETRSDWIKRPLSEKQILYAANDVRYLLQIREILSRQIESKGMMPWLAAECAQQLAITCKAEDPSQWQTYYAGLSNAWRLDTLGLQALQQLCVWREQQARQRNKPRSWIVKDADLLNLCAAVSPAMRDNTLSLDDLSNIASVDQRFLSRNSRELLRLLDDSKKKTDVDPTLLNKPLSPSMRKTIKLTKQAATAKAEELGMSPELLGRKKYLLELLRDYENTGELNWSGEFAGWRRELLEIELTAILRKA